LGNRPTTYYHKKLLVTETNDTLQNEATGGTEIVSTDIMTTRGESQREAQRPTRSVVTPKTTLAIGHWNVRTMFQTGKSAQIAKEMDQYGLGILGISECRWNGAGKQKLATGHTIIYSGDEERHERGVAIMMNAQAEKALMEWTPVNERIITARFYSRFRRLTVIQVYAPHNEKEDTEKEQFYGNLQDTLDEVDQNDIIIMMGDLNAKVGHDNNGYERTMGRQGLGNRNDNGEIMQLLRIEWTSNNWNIVSP